MNVLNGINVGAVFVSLLLSSFQEPLAQVDQATEADSGAQLLVELEAHASWCQNKKLYADRDRTFGMILVLDPDHAGARKALKYKREGSAWKQSKSYRAPRDRNSKHKAAEVERRRALCELYLERMLERLDSGRGELDPTTHEAIVARLLALAPDDARLREALGEVWDTELEAWILADTRSAVERRLWLSEKATSLLEGGLPVEDTGPNAFELGLGLPWSTVVRSRHVRVLGTGERENVLDCARHADAAMQLLRDVCGLKGTTSPWVLYVLEDWDEMTILLASHPGLRNLEASEIAATSGAWVPMSNQFVLYKGSPLERRTTVANQALAWSLCHDYGVSGGHGWAFDGLKDYLGDLLQPHRGTKLLNGVAGWDGLLLDSTEGACGVSARARGSRYVLMRYLIESHPERMAELLQGFSVGRSPAEALGEAFGLHPELVGARILRWARETNETSGPLLSLDADREADVWRAVARLSTRKQERLLERCIEAAGASGARQVELVRSLQQNGEAPPLSASATLEAHDARRYKGGPRRRLVRPGNRRWEALRAELPSHEAPSVVYEYSTGNLALSPATEESAIDQLRRLLHGVLPGQEMAQALLLQAMDRPGALRAEAEYFAHLYCDRDANAYEGITLLEVWDSGILMEIPDPDARAYAIKIWKDATVRTPLSQSDHDEWYPRIAQSMHRLRKHMRISQALAATWFQARPALSNGYDASIDILHGLLALENEDLSALSQRLAKDGVDFLEAGRSALERAGNAAWNAGNARRDELLLGEFLIRQAVLEVLRDEGLL